MTAIVENIVRESDISVSLWDAFSGDFAYASEGTFGPDFYAAAVRETRSFDIKVLHPATIHQALWYGERIDFSAGPGVIASYGYLREGYFPWPIAKREEALHLNGLCDQRVFAVALLLNGQHEAYVQHVSHYPNIFPPQV